MWVLSRIFLENPFAATFIIALDNLSEDVVKPGAQRNNSGITGLSTAYTTLYCHVRERAGPCLAQ